MQSGSICYIAAMWARGLAPCGPEALKEGIKKFMAPKLVDMNMKAVDLGVEAVK